MDFKLNNRYIHHLLFTDDQVITDEDTIYLFCKLKNTYAEWRLSINISKMEHLTISLNLDDALEDIILKNDKILKSLGSIIHQNGSCYRDVEKELVKVE